jgi:acyl-CoA synthetase (AMP-forming)/AMP-acid ligase II
VSGLPTTLPAAWAERWEHEPDRAQLHEPTSGWHTRGALDAASRAAAGRLYGLGIRKGDRVLLSATASVDLVVAHVACLRLGAIVVPVNGAYRRPEVAHVVTDATPRLARMARRRRRSRGGHDPGRARCGGSGTEPGRGRRR